MGMERFGAWLGIENSLKDIDCGRPQVSQLLTRPLAVRAQMSAVIDSLEFAVLAWQTVALASAVQQEFFALGWKFRSCPIDSQTLQ